MYLPIEIICSCTGAVVGAITMRLAQLHFYKRDKKDKNIYMAIMLYYELQNIKHYVEHTELSCDLSYSIDWNKMILGCDFLSESDVNLVCGIFSAAYVYDCNYTNLQTRETIPGYIDLLRNLKKDDFNQLMDKLKAYIGFRPKLDE